MSCECNCRKFIKSIKIEVADKKVTITIPKVDFKNNEEFDLVICQSIPKAVAGAVVELSNGGTVIDMWDRNGNLLMGERLFSRTRYCSVFGDNDSEHILIRNRLPINKSATEAK